MMVNRMIVATAIPLILTSVIGKKNLRYSENATPTAAMEAVLITATADQPYRYPQTGPYASLKYTY